MNKKFIVACLLSVGSFFGMQAMRDSGNRILNDVKQALQNDDNAQFDAFCDQLPPRLAQVFTNDEAGTAEFEYFTEEYFRFIDYINLPGVGAPNANFETNCKRLERVFIAARKRLERPVLDDRFYEEDFAPTRRSAYAKVIKRSLIAGLVVGTVIFAGLLTAFFLKGDKSSLKNKKGTAAV